MSKTNKMYLVTGAAVILGPEVFAIRDEIRWLKETGKIA